MSAENFLLIRRNSGRVELMRSSGEVGRENFSIVFASDGPRS